jgi:prepilin-type N-terminal cleavage/methylation domain-containing protein
MRKLSPPGFSLLEVIISLAILVTVMLSVHHLIAALNLQNETNRQIKIAVFDAQSVLEGIIGTPFDQIMDPDYPSVGTAQPLFPHNVDLPAYRTMQNDQNEQILVTYTDANGTDVDPTSLPFTTPDPLYVTITVTWTGPRQIPMQYQLFTARTR